VDALRLKNKKNVPAKITRPALHDIIQRPRLFAELEYRRDQPATWIAGPAGAGKTTLTASHIDNLGLPCLWYTIDPSDNDPATFFYYMGLAAKHVAPTRRRPLPLLSPAHQMGLPNFARRFFEKFYERLSVNCVVVLDDYHELSADAALHDILAVALATLPEGIQFIILSRHEPPARLARHRTGRLGYIGWHDLRFTEEETRQYVQLKTQQQPDDAAISLARKKTDGWAAGLALLVERRTTDLANIRDLDPASRDTIFAYFTIEIFQRASRDTQQFLLKTAFLPTMTLHMAQRLVGKDTAQSVLAELHTTNSFLQPRQGVKPLYGYHPLFQEFLRAKAREVFAEQELASLRSDTASVLLDAGHMEEAASLLIDAENFAHLLPLILQHAPALAAQGRIKTLADWINAVPPNLAGTSPWLLYWQGLCHLAFAPGASQDIFIRAFQLFEAQNDTTGLCLAWAGIVNSFMINFDKLQHIDPWIDWLDAKMAQGMSFPSRECELTVSASMTIALIHRRPTHPGLQDWAQKTLALPVTAADFDVCMPMFPMFAYYYICKGELEHCSLAVTAMHKALRTHSSPLLKLSMHLAEAFMHSSFAIQHQDGLRSVLAGIDLADTTGVHSLDAHLFGSGVQNALNAGDMAQAQHLLMAMGQNCGTSRGLSGYYYMLAGWHALCCDEYAKAISLARQALKLAEDLGLIFPEIDTRMLLTIALDKAGQDHETEQQFALVQHAATALQSPFLDYKCSLLAAHFALCQGDDNAAMAKLTEALALGRQHGYATLVNFWVPDMMVRLCAKALAAGIETDHVRSLIRHLGLNPDQTARTIDTWPWPVDIQTLGRFEVRKDGLPLAFKGKAPHMILLLLKTLVSCGPDGAREEQLADMLWPNADGDAADKTLEISLYRLRKLLGGNHTIHVSEGHVRLSSEYCRTDAHVFEELLEEAQRCHSSVTHEASVRFDRAVSLYRGHFLEGSSESWILAHRQRLRDKYLRAVIRLGNMHEEAQRFDEAAALYEQGLASETWAEALYRGGMRCHLARGRRAETVAMYRRCQQHLLTAFGVRPSEETEALFRQATC